MTQAVFLLKQGADPNVEYNSTALGDRYHLIPVTLWSVGRYLVWQNLRLDCVKCLPDFCSRARFLTDWDQMRLVSLDIKKNEFPIKLAFTTLKVAKFYIKAKPVKKSESLKIFASSKSVNFADKEGNVADVTIHP